MAESVSGTARLDDPNRCQTTLANGQCRGIAMPGSQYCSMHGGNKAADQARKIEQKNYNLAKWQQKVGDKADSENLFSLKEEIGILRMMLEERLNACNDVQELMQNSPQITTFIEKIERLVGTLFKIENTLGERISKDKLVLFADSLVGMLISRVEPEILKLIEADLKKAFEILNGTQAGT